LSRLLRLFLSSVDYRETTTTLNW